MLTLAITSDSMPLSQVEDLVDTRLAPKLSQLNGVGLVSISGGQKPAVRIQANPAALASYGLTLEQFRTALIQTSVNAAKGNFDGPRQDYQIDANDQLQSSADYKNIVVAYRNGAPVMLKDVARVVDGVENNNQAAWMNQTPAVILNIQRQPGANTISVVKSIKNILPQLETNLPATIKVTEMTDLTVPIEASVSDVEFELMLTVVLVVLVIFLFLRSLRATIIPGGRRADLPGRHAGRHVCAGLQPGQSLHDGAYHRHRLRGGRRHRDDREHLALPGRGRFTAAGRAQGRRADRLHHCLAHGFAHCRAHSPVVHGRRRRPPLPRIRRDSRRHHHHLGGCLAHPDANDVRAHCCTTIRRSSRHASIAFPSAASRRMINFYGRTLKFVLRYQTTVLLIAVGTLVLTIFLYIVAPKGFFPVQDTGVIQGISQAPETISFPAMAEKHQELTKVILADPAVESLTSFIGADGTNTTLNSGRFSINLKPLSDRDLSASDVIRRLQTKLRDVAGNQALHAAGAEHHRG